MDKTCKYLVSLVQETKLGVLNSIDHTNLSLKNNSLLSNQALIKFDSTLNTFESILSVNRIQ